MMKRLNIQMPTPVVNAGTFLGDGLERVRHFWAVASWPVRWSVYLLLIVAALLLPNEAVGSIMVPSGVDWPGLLASKIAIYILMALGLNIVIGMAGLLDLGYVAFFAVGGYTIGVFGERFGWNFWEVIGLAILLSALSGVILGGPTLRLRGDYLAIVTLGFGEIVKEVVNNLEYVHGPRGIQGIPRPPTLSEFEILGVKPLAYGFLDSRPYYYMLVAFIVITIIFCKRLEKSRVGRSWTAIREDEDAAELMGVPTFRFKLAAFGIGAAIGGSSGLVFAAELTSINPKDFKFLISALVLAAVVLGGSGNIPGVMLGAFMVVWLPERFRLSDEYRMLLFGAALVLMMALRPQGLWPSRIRKAELAGGSGGMGSMGAEVAGPDSSGPGPSGHVNGNGGDDGGPAVEVTK